MGGLKGNIDMGEEKRGNWQDVPLGQWVEGGGQLAHFLPELETCPLHWVSVSTCAVATKPGLSTLQAGKHSLT